MKKTKKIALLPFASLLALSLVACGDLNGTGGTGSGNGSSSDSGDSDVVAVLPGTSGGTSNTSDKFAGKTFYDKSSLEDSMTKYVFGNDGTFTVSSKESTYDSEAGKFEEPTYEYKYSLSSDGKTFYRAGNRATIYLITNITKTNLMTYSEFVNYLKSNEFKSATKEALGWDNISDEDKKNWLSLAGVDENAGFDEFYQAWLKMAEEMCKPYYSQVSPYSISTETDTSANISYILLTGTVDSDSKDLSKMNFTGSFDKSSSGSGSRIASFSIYSVISSSSVSIFSSDSTDYRYYSISKIDATKITFEKQASSSSEEKETFDATYTVEGSGTDTKIKVTFPADKGGETVELSFKPETMSLYEAK